MLPAVLLQLVDSLFGPLPLGVQFIDGKRSCQLVAVLLLVEQQQQARVQVLPSQRL